MMRRLLATPLSAAWRAFPRSKAPKGTRLPSATTLWRLGFALASLTLVLSVLRYYRLLRQLSHPCQSPQTVEIYRILPPLACTPVVYEDGFDYQQDRCSGKRYLPMLYDQATAERDIWRRGCNRTAQRIPKLLHLLELSKSTPNASDGVARLAPGRLRQVSKFLAMNPGWKVVVWRREELAELIRDFFPTFVKPVSKNVMLAKYLLLYKFGGLYLDWDFDARAPVDPLLSHYAVLSTLSELAEGAAYIRHPSPRIIMSAPGHPLMLHCLASVQLVSAAAAADVGAETLSPASLDSEVLLSAVRRHENMQPQTRNPSRTVYVAPEGQLLLTQQLQTGHQRLRQLLIDVRERRCRAAANSSPLAAAVADFCRRANSTAAYLAALRNARRQAIIVSTEPSANADEDPPASTLERVGGGGFSGRHLMQLVRDRGLWKFFPSYSLSDKHYELEQRGAIWMWM